MKSELHIESDNFDRPVINKELQLVPDEVAPAWLRKLPDSKESKSVTQQIQYWCNIFKHKKDAKNRLLACGYKISIVFYPTTKCFISIPQESLSLLVGYRLGLVIEIKT